MPDDSPDDLIPGVSESEVAGAIQKLTSIPASTLQDHERFLVAVRSLVEFRAQSGWQNEGAEDVAVFVLAPYPRKIGEQLGATPVSDVIATNDPLLGRIFFLNRDASSGRGMTFPVEPNEILEWLMDNKLDQLPVVTVYRNSKLLISRARGAMSDTRADIIRDKPPLATLGEIEEALVVSHREMLVTPTVCPVGVWEPDRAAEYVPGADPEKSIQRVIRIALTSWFHGVVKVEMEDTITYGRIDIRLLRPDSEGHFAYWVILELKVIRSSHNAAKGVVATKVTAGDNAKAVVEGIRQASAFGRDRKAEPFVDIYDLRKDKSDDVLSHTLVVQELSALSPKPECRVWPLYGSASDARNAGLP
jgi:hypothetical protein